MEAFLIKSLGTSINILSYISPYLSGRLSLSLFSKPRRKSYSQRQENIIAKSSTNTFLLHNKKQYYFNWRAPGKKVLLVHGWESNAGRWAPLVSQLQKANFNIFALDAPAHGKSQGNKFTGPLYAEAIDYLVTKYDIEYIIGHSVGAYSSIYYLSHFLSAQKISKAALLAPTNELNHSFLNFSNILGLSEKSKGHFYKHFTSVYDKTIDQFIASDMAKIIQCNTLLIHDKEDKVLPFNGSKEIQSHLQNCLFIETQGLGHRLISRQVYGEIENFLTGE